MAEPQSSSKATRAYNIIAGLDFSELGERAVVEAINLAKDHPDAELHVMVVGDARGDQIVLPEGEEPLAEDDAQERARERVENLVKFYQEQHGEVPLERVGVYVTHGPPAEQLVALAEAIDADVLVVGTHGRTGAKRLVLGSVAESVVRTAPCNVTVIKPKDFVDGRRVPEVQPPLRPGQSALKRHRPIYHYVDRGAPSSVMPAT